MRFRNAQQKKKKVAYTIHRSKSNKWRVTGGKGLKSTGEYTPQFCRAVLDMWRNANSTQGDWSPIGRVSYKTIWTHTFKESVVVDYEPCL